MLGVLWASCASGPATQPATHDDFRAIQRHEARMDARMPVATDSSQGCDPARAAAADVCEAAGAICRIADDTADLDAIDRCEAARDSCRRAEGAVGGRCDAP